MKNFSKLVIEPIYDPYDLSLTIKFLRLKFLSSYKWSYELLNHVLLMNRNYNLYGFKLMQGSKLRGAILSIYQGQYADNKNKLFDKLRNEANKGKPIIGICLGFQLLFSKGEEFGITSGLDVFINFKY